MREKNEIVVLGVLFAEENKKLAVFISNLVVLYKLDIKVKQNSDILEFMKYKVLLAPGIIINGELKSAGRTPTSKEIINWLEELN